MRRKSSILTGDSNPNDAFDLAIEWEAFPNNTLDGLGLYDATFDHTVPFNLVISEIMYDPNGSDENWEWIEVYNPNDVAVDLSGYILDDENGTAHNTANITSGIIAAKNTAILYDGNNTDFAIAWGSEINLIPVNDWSKMTLNNNGDKVSLWSNFLAYSGDHQNHTNTVDTVDYSGVNFPDSAGASIYLKDLTTDNNDGNNWVVSIDRETTPTGTGFTDQVWGSIGSPGGNFAPNTTDKTVTVAEDNSYTFQVS
ncbi:MAG: lamin tail domain-containing protein, partial [Cyanobacteria bacterium J06592_8]